MSNPEDSSSTSFDSSNSFYSTTNSSSHASLTSTPVAIADAQVFGDDQEVEEKIRQVLLELRDEEGRFQTLLDGPSVHIETCTDPKAPFCFRIQAHFPQNTAAAAFALFADIPARPGWDDICQDVIVLRKINPLTFIYHLKLKGQWPTTARDSLMIAAFRKLQDGRFISVAWSIIDNEACPEDPNFVRMHTRISANLFTPTGPNSFSLSQLIDGDPKGSIPAYVVKKVSTKSFPLTIERIKAAIPKDSNVDFYNEAISQFTSDAVTNEESEDELSQIRRRLNSLEAAQLPSSERHNISSLLLKWAPLTISTATFLLLLNLTFRKRKQ